VDAANLGLLLEPRRLETHEFVGGAVAVIDPGRCGSCGVCRQVCRFDAVLVNAACEVTDWIRDAFGE